MTILLRALCVLALLLARPALAQGATTPDLLPPAQAFRMRATGAADAIRLHYRIADGYYLYRARFHFESATPGVTFGAPRMRRGKIKHDPYFGRMETYRGVLDITLPLVLAGPRPATVTLQATSQGCADIGVCFPPYTRRATVKLAAAPGGSAGRAAAAVDAVLAPAPAAVPMASPAAPAAALAASADTGDFLPPDEAFRPEAGRRADGAVVVRWRIAPGYYLYRDKLHFRILAPAGTSAGTPRLPPAKSRHDAYFGTVPVYYAGLVVVLHPHPAPPAHALVRVAVDYQGCADAGLCYPPIKKTLVALAQPTSATTSASAGATGGGGLPAPDRIARTLADGNTWLVVASFFGFGLLLAFTPCVFPMVPILSGIVVGQGTAASTRRAFALSLVYVLAMALTYTAAGVLAGLFGARANLQAAFQQPWVLGAFSAFFVLLALSMFGVYELQLPAAWQTRLARLSTRQRGGTFAGVAVMGALSALIVGPCVAAPLAGALVYISRSGDAVLGGTALFAMALGMGVPLLAVGTAAGRLLPRAGAWMATIKAVFGVLMLAVAIYLMERVLPAWAGLALWSMLLLVTAVYMGALDRLTRGMNGWQRLAKGAGLVMLVYGVLLMVGAAGGGSDPLQPLRGTTFFRAGAGQPQPLVFHTVKGPAALDAALARAAASGRTVMLDYYADWCVSCKELERNTFTDRRVRAKLARLVLLRSDVTADNPADQAMLSRYGLFGPPAILFFGPDGRELTRARVVGYMDANRFLARLRRVEG